MDNFTSGYHAVRSYRFFEVQNANVSCSQRLFHFRQYQLRGDDTLDIRRSHNVQHIEAPITLGSFLLKPTSFTLAIHLLTESLYSS